MKNKYTHARTCVYNINYHIIWCVKYRRKVLTPEISSRLYELAQAIADEKGFTKCRRKAPCFSNGDIRRLLLLN